MKRIINTTSAFMIMMTSTITLKNAFILCINLFFIAALCLLLSYGGYLISYSNNLNENLNGRNYNVYLNISNETEDTFYVHDFSFIYDFSTNNGSIKFRTIGNHTASDIHVIFIPGIYEKSIEVECGTNIKTFNYDNITGELSIDTKNIYSNSYYTYYSINFSSNWTPKGLFKFTNVNRNTKIYSKPGKNPNVGFVLKEKYELNLYENYFNNLGETDYSADNYVQAYFPENSTCFSGSLKLSAINKDILIDKNIKLAFGISLVSGCIFSIIIILHDSLKKLNNKKR